ncbi:MAG TPA: DUF742 domain-containing protein [Pseudonocardiaceae bacterium]
MRASRVRPYAITGGRTTPDHDLTMETRVVVPHHDRARVATLPPESQAIYEQARQPISVGELAALLTAVPVTTLLVLLSDLITEDLVRVEAGGVEPDTLGRILTGLKELSP